MQTKLFIAILMALVFSLPSQAQVEDPYGVSKEVKSIFKKKKKKDKSQKSTEQTNDRQSGSELVSEEQPKDEEKPILVWSRYDFVPGDKIIFEDDLEDEENGEFPSRWDLKAGNVEVAEFGGENVIMFRDGHPTIMPYLKDPQKDYLPEVFTIEFDLYCGPDGFKTYLYDTKNQESGSHTGYNYLTTNYYRMQFGTSSSRHPDKDNLSERRWIHIAIAYNKGKLKAYMDETRLINIPRIDFDPKGLSLHSYHCRNDRLYYVKNIRIAEGGIKYYDRIMEDGKIVASGIRFDSGKATLRPESMGIINEIAEVMNDHPELYLSIEGHTDSDGDESSNLDLSRKRAETVKQTLIQLGIAAKRLQTAGFGESIPVDSNSTPEGKANNRRVEFVKIEQAPEGI